MQRLPLDRAGAFALGVALAVWSVAQEREKEKIPIELEPDVRPESVHVKYFLTGSFGGYGSFIDGENQSATGLRLPIYQDAQRAKSLKAIVYSKGCEIETLDLSPIPSDPDPYKFKCRKLGTVLLRGVVTAHTHPEKLTVQLRYMANWDHPFFGIWDGPVSMFTIAEVTPDRDGRFAIDVPDFANDRVTKSYKGQAEWWIMASEPETAAGGQRYWLEAHQNQGAHSPGTLAIAREYPAEIPFTATPF
jgi:hypothetical protein